MPELSVKSSLPSSSILPPQQDLPNSIKGVANLNPTLWVDDEKDHQHADQSKVSFSSTSQSVELGGPHIMDLQHYLSSKREFVCGSGAAFINICITFPINKVIFRQQLHGVSSLKALGQLRKDGLRFLYRGFLPPLLQKTTSMSIMFGSYTRCQDFLQDIAPRLPTSSNHILSALLAGTLEAALTPFERMQTLMQNRQFHNKFSNTLDAVKSLRSLGIAEYYRGLTIIVMRNGPSNVCFFLGREFLGNIAPLPKTQSEKIMKDFICGACLGAVISTFFFPFNVVKTHMQSKIGVPFLGVRQTFRVVHSERGGSFRKLFKGAHLNYTRSFISWGIINASYEYLLHTFFSIQG